MKCSPDHEVVIRSLTGEDEYLQAVELQKIIWRLPDYGDCLPTHLMRAVHETGGVVLGAFAGSQMVGFLLAFGAHDAETGFHHHSHILGVLPEWVHRHVGFELKVAHYRLAKEQGVPLITWTYDPLQGPNANLNINKLGAIVRIYKVNYYGETMGGSELIGGIPSDRFWTEWWVGRPETEAHLKQEPRRWQIGTDVPVVNRVTAIDSREKMTGFDLPAGATVLAVRIPADFQELVDHHRDLARDWRLKSRELFLECFRRGFEVVDFVSKVAEKKRENFYILRKR